MPHLRRTPLLWPLAALASLIIFGGACAPLGAPVSTPTPTGPQIMCTAPACQPNKSYYCPGQCPGGCGTTCATHTPGPTPTSQCPPGAFFLPEGGSFKCMTPTAYVTDTPAQIPCLPGELYLPVDGTLKCVTPTPVLIGPPGETTPLAPAGPLCLIVTRTPPPSAPTFVPGGPADAGRRVDPHVEVCASPTTLKVGESFTLVGQVVDIGLPYFFVMVRPSGAGDFQPLVSVTYNNEIKPQPEGGEALELISARGDMHQLIVVLRTRSAGALDVVVNATGEVHYGYPGPALWQGGSSSPLTIVVQR